MMKAELVCERSAQLGEGAHWVADESEVYWVDILGRQLIRTGLGAEPFQAWDMPEDIGAGVRRHGGGFLVALRDGLHFFDERKGDLTFIVDPEADLAGNRFNDGCLDKRGRFWVGTMDYAAEQPTGSLYLLHKDLSIQKKDTGYIVTNGPAFSPRGDVLYHNETMRGQVFSFGLDMDSGTLTNKKLLIDIPEAEGLPDGLTVDAAGNLWIAHVTGGKVVRYSPDGQKLSEVKLPTPIVTSCCFGGPDLSTLYVTTGRILMNAKELQQYPLSGSLFAIQTDTQGQGTTMFGG